ncbi:CRP-like cAMP-binding protein [Saccharothrix coeruleofusca]|nr:CRP-like cAMP-binding protein [Saccharothrix coeruleofusca]
MSAGAVGDCVMVLRHGHVKILSGDAAGRERLLAVRGRGELLGEMALFSTGTRTASVVAHDAVTVVKIAEVRFRGFLDKYPSIQGDILRLVIAKLRALEGKRVENGPGTAVPRLLRALVEAAEACGDLLKDGAVLVPFTQNELGQMAEMSVLSAHRAVKVLRERKLLGSWPERGKVLVPCLGCLRAAALSPQMYGQDISGCGGVRSCPRR